MTKLSWEELWDIGTALHVRINQLEESIKVLAKYEDIVEMNKRDLKKLQELEAKVNSLRLETEYSK
jgi:hypothetical protein